MAPCSSSASSAPVSDQIPPCGQKRFLNTRDCIYRRCQRFAIVDIAGDASNVLYWTIAVRQPLSL